MPKKNFSDFVVRNRIIFIVVLILATLFFGYEITRLKLNADFSTYLKQDDPLVKEYNLIGEIFAGKSLVMVPIESENVFSFQTLSFMLQVPLSLLSIFLKKSSTSRQEKFKFR